MLSRFFSFRFLQPATGARGLGLFVPASAGAVGPLRKALVVVEAVVGNGGLGAGGVLKTTPPVGTGAPPVGRVGPSPSPLLGPIGKGGLPLPEREPVPVPIGKGGFVVVNPSEPGAVIEEVELFAEGCVFWFKQDAATRSTTAFRNHLRAYNIACRSGP